jgi:hypothetical protein
MHSTNVTHRFSAYQRHSLVWLMLLMPLPEGTAVNYEALTLTRAFSSVGRALDGISPTSTIRKSRAMLSVYGREATIKSTGYGYCRGSSKPLDRPTPFWCSTGSLLTSTRFAESLIGRPGSTTTTVSLQSYRHLPASR